MPNKLLAVRLTVRELEMIADLQTAIARAEGRETPPSAQEVLREALRHYRGYMAKLEKDRERRR